MPPNPKSSLASGALHTRVGWPAFAGWALGSKDLSEKPRGDRVEQSEEGWVSLHAPFGLSQGRTNSLLQGPRGLAPSPATRYLQLSP